MQAHRDTAPVNGLRKKRRLMRRVREAALSPDRSGRDDDCEPSQRPPAAAKPAQPAPSASPVSYPTMRYATGAEEVQASPDLEFAQLPAAKGLRHAFLQSRVEVVAQRLGGEHYGAQTKEAILSVLPHLARPSHSLQPTALGGLEVQRYVDHTLLKADARQAEVAKLCAEARQHRFFAVCVNSSRVADCAMMLRGSNVALAAVVGFPLGAMQAEVKALEAEAAIKAGATEIDMVLNVGMLQDGEYAKVFQDIQGVARAARGQVKVILETCLLTEEQIVDACILSAFAGAEFVKTSTGFSKGGATPGAVDLMKATVGNTCKVKASGGVRDLAAARKYIAAGVSRIGTSSGIAIVSGQQAKGY
eukprot:TRINITY_DN60241_c0_g1_i1.p1 TRINITY_DN60241_c0_g1~~TRINITY_DN60241_c0_g1_i1.p1  ORF type:complete len:361 (+),score=105.69 TRINITY_DN60241_c0_g1_i1:73-1155(+)